MILVRDTNGKVRCAKCYKLISKVDVVKDRFLPTGLGLPVNVNSIQIGVCKDCHKERLKHRLVFPSYYKHLSKEQSSNLLSTMRYCKGYLISHFNDCEDKLNKL